MALAVGDRADLAEMPDAERPHPMAVNRAEPRQGRRMTVEDAADAATARQAGEQPLAVPVGI